MVKRPEYATKAEKNKEILDFKYEKTFQYQRQSPMTHQKEHLLTESQKTFLPPKIGCICLNITIFNYNNIYEAS